MGHSCGTVVGTSVSYETSSKTHTSSLQSERFARLPPKFTRQPSKTRVSYDETSSKTHASSLQNKRFVRDFLQKSRVNPPKRAFRTRLRQKLALRVCKASVSYETSSVTRQSSKTSVSYETASKSHMAKSPKRAFRTRLPPKVKRQGRQSIQIKQPCRAVSRLQGHTPITMSRRHSPRPQLVTSRFPGPATKFCNSHRVLRLPRNAISATPRNLTIPCTCHENCTSTPQSPRKVLRLPPKVTISYHVSFKKICTTPHVWNDFETF